MTRASGRPILKLRQRFKPATGLNRSTLDDSTDFAWFAFPLGCDRHSGLRTMRIFQCGVPPYSTRALARTTKPARW